MRGHALLLAAAFLFPLRDRPSFAEDRIDWRRAARYLTLWGLVIGIVYAAVYRGSWRWFGEYQKLRIMPAIVLLIVDTGWCGYRPLVALARTFAGRAAGDANGVVSLPTTLALLLTTLLKFGLFVFLPVGAIPYAADWREHIGPLYPDVIYRPLVLMPLWGRWGMMMALCIGRIGPAGSGRIRQMAGGLRLSEVMLHWLPIALLTVAYSSPDAKYLAQGVVIALVVLVITYLAGFVMALRRGGQDESTVSATGLFAELGFLVLYLPIARAIHSY